MIEPDDKQRLADLEARIAAMKKGPEARNHQEEHYSMAQHAWRMVTELVAGLGIGFGIGFGLDSLFGTTPFLLVLFTLLGFVAGVQTMIRSANELQKAQTAAMAEEDERTKDGD